MTDEDNKGKKGKKKLGLDFALQNDPAFMEKHLKDTKRVYDVNLATLEDIRDGKIMDSQYDPKLGVMIERPVSMDVRVKAIAQINAMTLHKVMADKRESIKTKTSTEAEEHASAMKKIMDDRERERKEAEQKALQEGKLVKIKKQENG